ncbi:MULTISPECIES: methyltransferase domain-containing protein [unclassified Paracoccus (in: a-proteobacteria)]|nr:MULTISPECIES: methyltransferase domain-containing protein [unclassified Paracoccus (in: a-proteobacteria)]MBB1492360.1 DUF1698 domain-containing protein [Paracoccus sp. MC1854]QQO45444.1 DUF1698 domain-containing protein [Paracoccus sp. MC1862]
MMAETADFSGISGATPIEPLATPLAPDALREQVVALGPWFHNIDLAPGLSTRGIAPSAGPQPVDHPLRRWQVYEDVLPQDMTGMRVLDLGSAEGFFALEMARRGAFVLAQDFWGAMIRRLRFAAQVTGLQDRIWTRIGNVTAIQPGERYDAVLALGLLYHLRHPFHDLEIISRASDLLWLETTLHEGEESFLYFKPPAEGVHHVRKWFPTRACVRDMLEECRFTMIEDIPDPTPNRGSFMARR